MALQVCNRCRKRKIRCDLRLPACKNCRLADVECMFWDDSLGEEIPCAYLHSLQQRVQSLELEIRRATDQGGTTSATIAHEVNAVPFSRQAYHLELADLDELLSPPRTAYLGPGSSARLCQRFLTSTSSWHVSNDIQIPSSLLTDDQSHSKGLGMPSVAPCFPIHNDVRKVELHSLVPPSTQRAIIEHYLKVVAPEYTLLVIEQDSPLLSHENPLKWISSKKDDPAAWTLTMVFAISTALITRDLDPNLASVSLRSREEVQRLSLEGVSGQTKLSATRWSCTALCVLALCELICPTSGQLWDLLGRATSTMEDMQEVCLLKRSDLDLELRRLEHTLFKLESLAMRHFGRPSLFFDTRIQAYLDDGAERNAESIELYIASSLHSISRALTTEPVPNEIYLENLIPLPHQVTYLDSEISLSSATLYVALYPLVTGPDSFTGRSNLTSPSPRMVQVIAKSACVIIDHFTELNQEDMIVSIWVAAERVLEAGAAWAACRIHQQRSSSTGPWIPPATQTGAALSPIVKVSTLLASFEARWKTGSVYTKTWKAMVELLWKSI